MSIAPLPRHPGSIRAVNSGPPVVRTLDDDAFAETLRAMAAERFNENGFFADADAVTTPRQAIVAPSAAFDIAEPPPGIAALSAVEFIAPSGSLAATSPTAASVGAAVATPIDASAAPAQVSIAITTETKSVVASLPRSFPRAPMSEVAAPSSVGKARAAQSEAARARIDVSSFGTRDGAVAITVAAPGLTDREAAALRVDIVDLLRRHGLVLDDLRLNGRPMEQGNGQSES